MRQDRDGLVAMAIAIVLMIITVVALSANPASIYYVKSGKIYAERQYQTDWD